MRTILILVSISLLFGCASTDNTNGESKYENKANTSKVVPSPAKVEKALAPTPNTAIIRSIKAKHIFDQTTVVSTLEKAFDEQGKIVYETPLITWNGPKPVISLPAGQYVVLIGCWANGGSLYNYHKIKANFESEKDYTFFCLQQTGKMFLGFNGIIGLHGFYSETSQLESAQKKYQAEIDSVNKK